VPAHLTAWLAQELVGITEESLRVAIAYLHDAIDSRARAMQIETDQSLTSTEPSLTEAVVSGSAIIGGNVLSSSLPLGPFTTTVIGGDSLGTPLSGSPILTSTVVGGSWSTPLLDAAQNLQQANPGAAAQLFGLQQSIFDSNNDMIRTTLAPNGLTFSRGAYVDAGGDRETSLSGAYRDPVTGKYDL
jgi:hypothetical protein